MADQKTNINTFVCFPNSNFEEGRKCLWRWKSLGYDTLVLFDSKSLKDDDPQDLIDEGVLNEFVIVDEYKGWYVSCNWLNQIAIDKQADWIINIGADMDPDPSKSAESIAKECRTHFNGTYGVMQPTADDFDTRNGLRAAERICGSPWLGRQFIQSCRDCKAWDETPFHFFGDERLRDELIKDDLLWQRSDLCHLHRHPSREKRAYAPGHTTSWNDDKNWFNSTIENWQAPWRIS